MNNKQVKIKPKSSIAINIVKELKSRDMELQTYKPKQKRNFKIVFKHIYHRM